MPSNSKGRFGKQDFVNVAADDVYLYPASEQLTYHYSNEEHGKILRRYWDHRLPSVRAEGTQIGHRVGFRNSAQVRHSRPVTPI